MKVSVFRYFGRQMVFLHGHPGNLRVNCWFHSVVASYGDSLYAKRYYGDPKMAPIFVSPRLSPHPVLITKPERYSNTGRSVLYSQFNVQYSLSTSNQSSSRIPNEQTAAYMQILIHAVDSSPEGSEVGSRSRRLRQKSLRLSSIQRRPPPCTLPPPNTPSPPLNLRLDSSLRLSVWESFAMRCCGVIM